MVTIGSRGDLQPFLGLAAELKRRGHEVCIASHQVFHQLVTERGFTFQRVAGNPQMAFLASGYGKLTGRLSELSHDPWSLEQIARPVARIIARALHDAMHACKDSDVVLYTPLLLPLQAYLRNQEIPSILVAFQPLYPTADFPSPLAWLRTPFAQSNNYESHVQAWHATWQVLQGPVNDWLRHDLAMPGVRDPDAYFHWLEGAQPQLYAYSSAFIPKPGDWPAEADVVGWWLDDVGRVWEPPPDLAQFLQNERPIFVDLLGGGAPDINPGVWRRMRTMLRNFGHPAIVRAPANHPLSAERDDRIYFLESVPHAWLLERVSLFVHHAGAGVVGAALAAGVPSIPVFHTAEKGFWAFQMHRAGLAARPILRGQMHMTRLEEVMDSALKDERMRARLAVIAAFIRGERGTARAADAVEKLKN